jgi:hypothetical protein
MYVSFDGGAHWQPLQQNLPMTSVRDIDVHGNDLVIATHGRGFWIMDDVSALRQMDASRANTVTLFKPADAIRVRPAGFTGTPFPKDEPMAANPPDGAIIDYALPNAVKGAVTLAVFDAQKHKIRSFSSADPVTPVDPTKLKIAPEWVPAPMRLSTAPGMHRFVWDLRYPKPAVEASSDDEPESAGVWSPPGPYTVELNVDGRSYTQPLLLKPDPRVQISQAAFQREFELARKVEDASTRAAVASTEAGKLLKALDARQVHADSGLHASIGALMDKVSDLSGVETHPDPRNSMGSPPHRTDSLRALSMSLGKLEQAVDGADADPSTDAQTSYAALSQTLTNTLDAWQQLKRVDLATLNAQLKAAGEKPVAL